MVVIAPRNRRWSFLGCAIGAAAVVCLPFVVLTSGRAIRGIVIGGATAPASGGTLLAETHLHGPLLVAYSRASPVVLSMVLARWLARRMGSNVLQPLPLVSLVALSLCFRLVFEVSLWGYYFMAVAVSLVLMDVLRGRLSVYVIGWLAVFQIGFDPLPWGG